MLEYLFFSILYFNKRYLPRIYLISLISSLKTDFINFRVIGEVFYLIYNNSTRVHFLNTIKIALEFINITYM